MPQSSLCASRNVRTRCIITRRFAALPALFVASILLCPPAAAGPEIRVGYLYSDCDEVEATSYSADDVIFATGYSVSFTVHFQTWDCWFRSDPFAVQFSVGLQPAASCNAESQSFWRDDVPGLDDSTEGDLAISCVVTCDHDYKVTSRVEIESWSTASSTGDGDLTGHPDCDRAVASPSVPMDEVKSTLLGPRP